MNCNNCSSNYYNDLVKIRTSETKNAYLCTFGCIPENVFFCNSCEEWVLGEHEAEKALCKFCKEVEK